MSKSAQTQFICSKWLRSSNSYVKAMYDELSEWVFDETEAQNFKGNWRQKVFFSKPSVPLDIEIGPGSGESFVRLAQNNKNRLFLGIELKYKPLVQSTRKLKACECQNARLIRYNARLVSHIFAKNELNNIYIHFPDPWPKTRHVKHRLVKPDFLETLHGLQNKNSFIEIKTDHKSYCKEIKAFFQDSPYQLAECSSYQQETFDQKKNNFMTNFERLFLKKGMNIYYLKYFKGF